jgi:glyoxylate reductase
MPEKKILITRRFLPDVLKSLSDAYETVVWSGENPPPYDWVMEHIIDADALICMLNDRIDEGIISAGANHKLKVISQMAVGVDNIAVSAATSHKIPVGHTPGVLTETTADFAWALLMASARRVVESHNEVHHGLWRPWGPEVWCGVDVYGATLGLVGFGRIGKAMARRAAGFNMKVLYYEPRRKSENDQIDNASYVSLEELLQTSDFVSLHAYLSPATRGMISKAQLKMLKPSAILINTARGAMLDHAALTDALKDHRLAGAALDVFDPEPIPQDHPLLSMPNVIITPHIASSTTTTRRRMAVMTVENIRAGLEGKPMPYCFNPQVYQ